MAKIQIDKERCKGCYLCINACPKASLVIEETLNKKGFKPVGFKKGSSCIGCCFCALMCPDCCIEVIKE
jgi:2-oxoglutarate ferredoxin oxidoreductase subunit delta